MTPETTGEMSTLKRILYYSDVGVALLAVSVVVMLVIPLPTWLIDLLLACNITLGVVVLLTTFYVKRALEFAVFPTLLLIVTIFRIALSVSTTRLILLQADAGSIVTAFGSFVVGGSYVVGAVIFLILVIIQLIVITKGAERVAEVAARFTLDAMPGKQMAIDADLNAGLIEEDEAKERRKDIQREADFYGAMDGASKFVKGDAIAQLLITIINIVGGLSIGVFQRGMSIGDAARLYTLLTIGDGLVSQIPALLFSTATGVIVSRAAATSDLGQDLVGSFTKYPRPLYIGSGMLFALAIIPGLPTVPFVTLGGMIGGMGYMVEREGKVQEIETAEKKQQAQTAGKGGGMAPSGSPQAPSARPDGQPGGAPASPEDVMRLLTVEPMEAEIGYAIIPLVDPAQGGDMLERIGTIRKQMAVELGLLVPPIRIRDNIQIKPTEYVLRIKGAEAGRGELLPDHYLAMNTGAAEEDLVGIPTTEPAFGLSALWIAPDLRDKAESMGYTVVDAPSVLATHLSEVIKKNGAELLTRQEIQKLTEMVKENAPAVVDDLLASLSLGEIQKVLQNLIREQVPIRDLVTIFEALADYGKLSRSVDFLTERARESLARLISLKIQANNVITVATLSPNWEQKIMAAMDGDLARGWQLNLDPREVQKMISAISGAIDNMLIKNLTPVLLVHPNVRLIVRRLIEGSLSSVFVISYNEIASGIQIKTVGMVE